jgi:hypothetical protein
VPLCPTQPSAHPLNLIYILLATAVSKPALYMLLTLHLPNITSFSVVSFASENQSRSEAFFISGLQTDKFLLPGVVSTSPNPKHEGPPLVGCPRLFIQYSHSYLQRWRPFLQPKQRTRHAVVTGNDLARIYIYIYIYIYILFRTLDFAVFLGSGLRWGERKVVCL